MSFCKTRRRLKCVILASILYFILVNSGYEPQRFQSSVVHHRHISVASEECKDLFSRVKAGTLQDPNYTNQSFVGKALHSKETTTFPSFWISLHNEQTDPVRWSIMTTGDYYESYITRFTKNVFSQPTKNPNGTRIFIDVGMNIGWFSLWALKLRATVYSFEPNPINRLRFCESLTLNNQGGVHQRRGHHHLYPIALSDQNSEMLQLVHRKNNPGEARLDNDELLKKHHHQQHSNIIIVDNVRVRRLDDVAQEAGLFDNDDTSIALLKIDVEGHDPQVLFGAQKLLKSNKVLNIFMEYSCRISNEKDLKTVVDEILVKAGYEIEIIGNWNGEPRKGAKDVVHTTIRKGLGSRLYEYCIHESQYQSVSQFNIWWKLKRGTKES